MKTLRALIWAKQWQAVQATIDGLLALYLLNDAPAEVQYARGERLHGTLSGGSVERDLLVRSVMDKLGREPLALPHTPGQEPPRVLMPTPPKETEAPHSRACGFRAHEHGYDCHPTCPTCRGGRR